MSDTQTAVDQEEVLQNTEFERSMVEIGGEAVDGYVAQYEDMEVVGYDIDDAVTQLLKKLGVKDA